MRMTEAHPALSALWRICPVDTRGVGWPRGRHLSRFLRRIPPLGTVRAKALGGGKPAVAEHASAFGPRKGPVPHFEYLGRRGGYSGSKGIWLSHAGRMGALPWPETLGVGLEHA